MNGIGIAETIQSGKKQGNGQGVASSKEFMEGLQLLVTTKAFQEKTAEVMLENKLTEGKKFKELRGQDFLYGH